MTDSLGTILTAMVTPFDDDLAVDHDKLAALADHLLANGSDGLVVAGTTGESPTLSDDEKVAMFQTVVEHVAGRGTVVAGTGSNDTRHSVELTSAAEKCGADAVLLVAPYYNKPPERGLLEHFRAVAAATSLPVIVYNIPGRCVVNLRPELLAEIGAIENVVAVKQANPDLDELCRLRDLSDIGVYAGNDDMLFDVLAVGGLGGICVASHLVGERMAEMARLYRAGDKAGASALDRSLQPLFKALFVTSNPILLKAALNLMGHEVGGLRLPLVPATREETAAIGDELRRQGILSAR
jgi:4-hydroxy-tetrahydrodipicolinate synthase